MRGVNWAWVRGICFWLILIYSIMWIISSAYLVYGEERKAKPFNLPAYDSTVDYSKIPEPTLRVIQPEIAEKINALVLGCYPAANMFDFEIKLEAGRREYDYTSTYENSGNFGAIVFSMPLYSSETNRRELDREFRLRETVAKATTELIKAVNQQLHFERLIDLYEALESRSRDRIAYGLADVNEQVDYLEKLSKANEDRAERYAKAIEAKLVLANYCEAGSRELVKKTIEKLLKS